MNIQNSCSDVSSKPLVNSIFSEHETHKYFSPCQHIQTTEILSNGMSYIATAIGNDIQNEANSHQTKIRVHLHSVLSRGTADKPCKTVDIIFIAVCCF